MSAVSCPECGAQLRLGDGLPAGSTARCPKCGAQVTVPDEPAPALPPAEGITDSTRPAPAPRGEGQIVTDPEEARERVPRGLDRPDEDEYDDDRDWRWKYRRDEFGADLDRVPLGRTGPLSNEYSVDFGRWWRIATQHFNGPMLGYGILYTFLAGMIQGTISSALDMVVPLAGTCLGILVSIPLSAGLVYVCLKELKGERWEFGHFFRTVQQPYLAPLLGSQLLIMVLSMPLFVPPLVLFIVGLILTDSSETETVSAVLLLSALVSFLVAVCVALFVHVRLGLFSVHLILDRGYGALDALKGNWELTRGHLLPLVGVVLILGLLEVGGVLLCYVGVFLAIPFAALILAAGYLLIAGTRPPVEGSRSRDEV